MSRFPEHALDVQQVRLGPHRTGSPPREERIEPAKQVSQFGAPAWLGPCRETADLLCILLQMISQADEALREFRYPALVWLLCLVDRAAYSLGSGCRRKARIRTSIYCDCQIWVAQFECVAQAREDKRVRLPNHRNIKAFGSALVHRVTGVMWWGMLIATSGYRRSSRL